MLEDLHDLFLYKHSLNQCESQKLLLSEILRETQIPSPWQQLYYDPVAGMLGAP